MKTNRWIEASRRVYARLLTLYPAQHRSEYGAAMQQLFHDQCRAAYGRRGLWSLLALWLHTFPDLGLSAVNEHLSAPGAKWGLLEAIPNRPLPWKGVALVLIPGLVLFTGQVAQTLGENWFFTALIWMPYLLMAVVLLVCLLTRKYPVWGLMPLGLLCSNLVYYGSHFVNWRFGAYSDYPLFTWKFFHAISIAVTNAQSVYYELISGGGSVWLSATFLLVPALLVGWHQRHRPLSRVIWLLLSAYLLLSIVQVMLRIQNYVDISQGSGSIYQLVIGGWGPVASAYIPLAKTLVSFWTLYHSSAFLILVCAGLWFARRYGDLAVLFPLGYVLGGVVYGVYGAQDPFLYLVIGVVLFYRILMAVVAPIWISRAPGHRRAWALTIPVVLACAAQIFLLQRMFGNAFEAYDINTAQAIPTLIHLELLVDPLMVVIGLILALVIYRTAVPAFTVEDAPVLAMGKPVPE